VPPVARQGGGAAGCPASSCPAGGSAQSTANSAVTTGQKSNKPAIVHPVQLPGELGPGPRYQDPHRHVFLLSGLLLTRIPLPGGLLGFWTTSKVFFLDCFPFLLSRLHLPFSFYTTLTLFSRLSLHFFFGTSSTFHLYLRHLFVKG